MCTVRSRVHSLVPVTLHDHWSRRSPKAQEVGPRGLLLTPLSRRKGKWHYCFPRTSQSRGVGELQAGCPLSSVDRQAPPSRRRGSTSAQLRGWWDSCLQICHLRNTRYCPGKNDTQVQGKHSEMPEEMGGESREKQHMTPPSGRISGMRHQGCSLCM